MLKDYRHLLTAPPSDEQAQRMLNILSATLLTALRTLPDTPENEGVRGLMDMGMVLAMYEKLADVMSRQAFLKEIERMVREEGEKMHLYQGIATLLS